MIDAPEASPALTAFLRGVERRAALFAQLQVGDPDAGDAALTTAMVGFRDAAARTPFGEWPRRFWSLLLAAPQLREPPRAPHWRGDFAWLGEIGAGPRAALLLRLVACVSEADAAGVLGVSRATYRLALRRALPRLQDGAPDETRFRALADAAQLALRDTPPERLAELARLREAALRGRVYTPPRRAPEPAAPARPSAGATPRPRWLRPALAAVAAATVLALAATFVFPGKLGPVSDAIRLDGLPETQPAARFDEEFAIVAHPDFALLASDDAEDAARDPAFLAWLTAQLERGDVAADVARPERAEDAADTDEHALEADSEP